LLKQWHLHTPTSSWGNLKNLEHFLQINGTAMGTKMAPSYANIFMGKLEKLIIQSAPHKPLSWLQL
jgi:hypothetical protein